MNKILIIDDDDSIVDSVSLILEDAGYSVDSTLKGTEAFAKAKKSKPDLILLDILLSGIDGRDICKRIKKDPETKNIPLIMISAHPSAANSVKECGADGFLAKPFGIDQLLDTIRKHVK